MGRMGVGPSIKLRVAINWINEKRIRAAPAARAIVAFSTSQPIIRTGRCQRLVQHRIDCQGPPRSAGGLVAACPNAGAFLPVKEVAISPESVRASIGGRGHQAPARVISPRRSNGTATTRLRCARASFAERWISTCPRTFASQWCISLIAWVISPILDPPSQNPHENKSRRIWIYRRADPSGHKQAGAISRIRSARVASPLG